MATRKQGSDNGNGFGISTKFVKWVVGLGAFLGSLIAIGGLAIQLIPFPYTEAEQLRINTHLEQCANHQIEADKKIAELKAIIKKYREMGMIQTPKEKEFDHIAFHKRMKNGK